MESSYGKTPRTRRKFTSGGAPYSTDFSQSKLKKNPQSSAPVNESSQLSENLDGGSFLGSLKQIFKSWFTFVPKEEETVDEVPEVDFETLVPRPLSMQDSFLSSKVEAKKSDSVQDIASLIENADPSELDKIEELLKKKRPREDSPKSEQEKKPQNGTVEKEKSIEEKLKDSNPNIIRPTATHKGLSSVDVINNFLRKNRTKPTENASPNVKKSGFPSKPLYYPPMSPWGPRPYAAPVFYRSPPTVTGQETASPIVKRQKPTPGYAVFPEWYTPYGFPSPYMMPYPMPASDHEGGQLQPPSVLANLSANINSPLVASEAAKRIVSSLERMTAPTSSQFSPKDQEAPTTSVSIPKASDADVVPLANKKAKAPIPSTPLSTVPSKKIEIPKEEQKKPALKPAKIPEKPVSKPQIANVYSALEDEEPVLVDDDEIETKPTKKVSSDEDSDGFIVQNKKQPKKHNKKQPESSPPVEKKQPPPPAKPVELSTTVAAVKPVASIFGTSTSSVTDTPNSSIMSAALTPSQKKSNWLDSQDEPQEDFYVPPEGYSDSDEEEKPKETKPAANIFGGASIFSDKPFVFATDSTTKKEEPKLTLFSSSVTADKPTSTETKLFNFSSSEPKAETKAEAPKVEEPPKMSIFGSSSTFEVPKLDVPKFGDAKSDTPKIELATPSIFFPSQTTLTEPTKKEEPKGLFGSAFEAPKEVAATNIFGFKTEPTKEAEKPKETTNSIFGTGSSSFTFGSTSEEAKVPEPAKKEEPNLFQFGNSSAPSQPASSAPAAFASPFGSSSTPSPFGASSTPSSSTPNTFTFGGSTGTSGNASTFGSASTSTPAPFGSSSTPSLFGATSSTPTPFGASSSSSQPFGSAFGNNTPSSSGFGGFGNTSTSAFGTSTPSAPTSGSSSFAFGGGNAFGSSTPFGGTSMPDSGMDAQVGPSKSDSSSIFGSSSSSSSFGSNSFGAFGATGASPFGAPAPTPSPFGATQQPTSFGGFGNPQQPQANNGFGAPSAPGGGGGFSIGVGNSNQQGGRKLVKGKRTK